MNLIEKTMENKTVELTTDGESLAKRKIQRGIFHKDALSPLLFLIAMIPFNERLRQSTGGYKYYKSQEVPVVQLLSSQELDTATRVQILDETDCISHSTNTLGEGMNPIILPPAMGKQYDRLGSSALLRQLVQEKENSEFKPVKLRLKN